MIGKHDIIQHALDLGFEDIGFTTTEPFSFQKEVLASREKEYAWIKQAGLDLMAGTEPQKLFPEARSIIVLVAVYFHSAYPHHMEFSFGRCYMDDDRITRNGLSLKIKSFIKYLAANGIGLKILPNLSDRLSAVRAGTGTYGKNCLFYSNKVALQSSWVSPIAIVVDHAFEPDPPTDVIGCPDWCKNVCLVACPTGALKGPRHLDPRRCISYLSYYDAGITAREFREPMGLRIYGCDHCQNVCPRNAPWLAQKLPPNPKVMEKEKFFDWASLLHMDKPYFEAHIRPHMFYMSAADIWRWQMNAARAMGNSLDSGYIADLVRSFSENADERVRGMAAWALGRIGGGKAKKALERFSTQSSGLVGEEATAALDMCGPRT
jgi:epoxyqueuosine reductase